MTTIHFSWSSTHAKCNYKHMVGLYHDVSLQLAMYRPSPLSYRPVCDLQLCVTSPTHEPRRHCVRWGPSFPSPKGAQPPPNFRPMSVVAKRLDRSRCHWYTLGPGDVVLDGVSAPPKRGTAPLVTARAMLCAVLGVVILSVCPSVTRMLCD